MLLSSPQPASAGSSREMSSLEVFRGLYPLTSHPTAVTSQGNPVQESVVFVYHTLAQGKAFSEGQEDKIFIQLTQYSVFLFLRLSHLFQDSSRCQLFQVVAHAFKFALDS